MMCTSRWGQFVAVAVVVALLGAGCATQPKQPVVTVAITQPTEPPIYQRWWFWVGIGAVVVAGIAIAASANSSEPEMGASELRLERPRFAPVGLGREGKGGPTLLPPLQPGIPY